MRPLYSSLGVRIRADFPLTLQTIDEQAGLGVRDELFVELHESSERFHTSERTHLAALARQTLEHPSIEVHTDGDEWSILCEQGERYARYSTRGDGLLRVGYRGLISPEDLAAPLEGPALGMALRLQGLTLLHASSVRHQGLGVAFGGLSGQGKSTLAALLLKQGAQFWGDDILRVLPQSADAFPDGRAARLHTESAEIASLSTGTSEPAHLASDKKKLSLADARFLTQPHRLSAFFALDRRSSGNAVEIAPLQGAEALMALMYSRYPTWMRHPLLDARDFDAFATLAPKIQVFRLSLPQGLEKMPQAAEELIRFIGGLKRA